MTAKGETGGAEQEVRIWLLLGIAALAIAGAFALLLALSRVPGAEKIAPWPLQFFQKGLVIHVVFSFVVWFLCMLGALAVAATYHMHGGEGRWRQVGTLAVWFVAFGEVLLCIPGLKHATEPSLNNYVPAILDPLYYLGLACILTGVMLAVLRLVATYFLRAQHPGPEGLGTLATGIIFLAALGCFAIAWRHVSGEAPSGDMNERLFWGGGHVLQFVNVGLMVTSWYLLGTMVGRRPNGGLFAFAMTALTTSALVGPSLYAVYEPFGPEQTWAFTQLQYALAPAPVLICLGILFAPKGDVGPDAAPTPAKGPEAGLARLALGLSFAVFLLGGGLGLFVDGADTRTPAHYHGVIGGVNLALMGLIVCIMLPFLDRGLKIGRAVHALFWMYGIGQALHSLGLFLAGGYGAPRKVAGDIAGLDALGAKVGLYMMGVGAVIAVAGGVMFIWMVGRALLRRAAKPETGAGPTPAPGL